MASSSFIFILFSATIIGSSIAKCTCDGSISFEIPNLPKVASDYLTKLFGSISAGARSTIEELIDEFKNAKVNDTASRDGFVTELQLFLDALSKGTIKSLDDLSNFFVNILGYIYNAIDFGGKLKVDGDLSADLKSGIDTIIGALKPIIDGVTRAGDLLHIPTCKCAKRDNTKDDGGLIGGLFGKK